MGGDCYAALTILRGRLGPVPDPALVGAIADLVDTFGQTVAGNLIRQWAVRKPVIEHELDPAPVAEPPFDAVDDDPPGEPTDLYEPGEAG